MGGVWFIRRVLFQKIRGGLNKQKSVLIKIEFLKFLQYSFGSLSLPPSKRILPFVYSYFLERKVDHAVRLVFSDVKS